MGDGSLIQPRSTDAADEPFPDRWGNGPLPMFNPHHVKIFT